MKKKILLSVFAVFSLMVASKSFAQFNSNFIKVDARIGIGNSNGYRYDNNGKYYYNDRFYQQNHVQLNNIHYDEQKLYQVQQRIADKKQQLQKDQAYGYEREFEEDQRDLRRLYEDVDFYQNRINNAKRKLFYDNRVSSYRRF